MDPLLASCLEGEGFHRLLPRKGVGETLDNKKVVPPISSGVPANPVGNRQPNKQTTAPDLDPYGRWLNARQQWRESPDNSLSPPDWYQGLSSSLRLAVIAMLREVAKGTKKLPGDVAFELAEAMLALQEGNNESFLLPDGAILHLGKGQPLRHPFITGLHVDAVCYVRAAQAGLIDDPQPVSSVATAYSVTRRTINRWLTKYSDTSGRREVVEGLDEAAVITKIMHRSGEHYAKQRGLAPKGVRRKR